ncbi:MAG: class I SAM-dependent methyltransferase [Pyrinomonadaceae bacterium]|nr:class I SAM-dependent methyltransferase [Pyrinomonadaceae bacterium]
MSSLKSRALDRGGAALPWYTYPAIEFLSHKEFRDRSVLEFGAGQSTIWWGERAKRVVSFESDKAWHRFLEKQVPGNVSLILVESQLSAVDSIVGETFDVIVIDGLERYECASKALEFYKANGVIVLDNSDALWGREGEYPIIDLFRSNDFARIDFYGYSPGVILPACTSLFFKDRCFLLSGNENPSCRVK